MSDKKKFLQRVRIARNTDRCNSHCRSVCLSVRPSDTFRCFDHTNEHTIMRFSATGRTIILVSGEVKFIRIFAGDHPREDVDVKVSHSPVANENLINNQP